MGHLELPHHVCVAPAEPARDLAAVLACGGSRRGAAGEGQQAGGSVSRGGVRCVLVAGGCTIKADPWMCGGNAAKPARQPNTRQRRITLCALGADLLDCSAALPCTLRWYLVPCTSTPFSNFLLLTAHYLK